jgi:hypothetical protein
LKSTAEGTWRLRLLIHLPSLVIIIAYFTSVGIYPSSLLEVMIDVIGRFGMNFDTLLYQVRAISDERSADKMEPSGLVAMVSLCSDLGS